MSKITSAEYHSPVKTLVACLIISLMILGPVAPLATAASVPAKSTKTDPALPSPDPAAPLAPSNHCTKDRFISDLTGDGKAAPGETRSLTTSTSLTSGSDATA
jgi:hypothetical protein